MTQEPLTPAPAAPPAAPPRRRRRGWWIALALLAVLVGGAVALRRGGQKPSPAQAGRDAQARPVAVGAATATRRDVPIDVDGLGTVTAFRTVTVRAQVDGRLDQVLFREGQTVQAGQVLAQIDPRPFRIQLQQAEGALARDHAQLENARRDLARYQALAAEKLIAQQQADTQVAAVGQLEGAVRVDEAAVATARLNLDYARITSPVAGVTGLRQVDPGNLVRATDANGLVLVTQLDPIAVLFTLPQDQLPAVADAMASGAKLAVDVYGREGTNLLGTGQLEVVDNQINQATSTVRLKAVLSNPRHLLWPNQFVKARLHVSTQRGALVVPATAVQRGPSGTFVYVIGADAIVSPRPVELGATPGDVVIVSKGLEEGERVVVDGQQQLRPGSKVVVPDAAHGPGGARGPGGSSGGSSGRATGGAAGGGPGAAPGVAGGQGGAGGRGGGRPGAAAAGTGRASQAGSGAGNGGSAAGGTEASTR